VLCTSPLAPPEFPVVTLDFREHVTSDKVAFMINVRRGRVMSNGAISWSIHAQLIETMFLRPRLT
jgi:hypothetical protein